MDIKKLAVAVLFCGCLLAQPPTPVSNPPAPAISIEALKQYHLQRFELEDTGPLGAGDINGILMDASVHIISRTSQGTSLILGKPDPKHPGSGYYCIVTAAHVFNAMLDDVVTLKLRRKTAAGFETWPMPLKIREAGVPLWKQHPTADVAAMWLKLPDGFIGVTPSTDLLATQEALAQIRPGDAVRILGFPLGAEVPGGYPLLRDGTVTSRRILVTREDPTFMVALPVFRGDSGGPVYLMPREGKYPAILGIMSELMVINEPVQTLDADQIEHHRVGLGKIVASPFIIELLESLPTS